MAHLTTKRIETKGLDAMSPPAIVRLAADISKLEVFIIHAGVQVATPASDIVDGNFWDLVAVTQAFVSLLAPNIDIIINQPPTGSALSISPGAAYDSSKENVVQ